MNYYSITPSPEFLCVTPVRSETRPDFYFSEMVGEVKVVPDKSIYKIGDWVLFRPEAGKGHIRIYSPASPDVVYTIVQIDNILGKVDRVPTI